MLQGFFSFSIVINHRRISVFTYPRVSANPSLVCPRIEPLPRFSFLEGEAFFNTVATSPIISLRGFFRGLES